MGAGGAFLIGMLRGRLDRIEIRRSLLQATRTAAAVFTVLIGALLFLTGLWQLWRTGADHADVSGAWMPHGRDGDDHPNRADHLLRDHPSRL